MGLGVGGTAIGIGMGSMAMMGGIVSLGLYEMARIIDKTGVKESPGQVFARMSDKIFYEEAYTEALLEVAMLSLENKALAEAWWQSKIIVYEIEEELQGLKQQVSAQSATIPENPPNPATEIEWVEVRELQIWQCDRVLKQHFAPIQSLAFHPNKPIIASAGDDKTINLWDLNTNKLIYSFFGHTRPVYALAFHPSGNTLIAGDFNNQITSWNLKTRFYRNFENHHRTSHDGLVYTVACNQNYLVSGSADKTLRLWHPVTGKLIKTIPAHEGIVCAAILHPDGSTGITSGSDRVIKIWDLNQGKLLRQLGKHNNWVTEIALTPDGETLISCSSDRTIKIWHFPTGELQHNLTHHTAPIWSVAIHPSGLFFASASLDNTVKIWRLPDGKLLQTLDGLPPLDFSPDGQFLITTGKGNILKIWQQTHLTNAEDILQFQPWWEVLKVTPNATFKEVKAAYRYLVKQYHPDINSTPQAKTRMQMINQAYREFQSH
ncbi:MAG: DnaJ domain-containing protein, partial [Jaaginema sp. PMC 1079.18]|nr:DnaJ domain-containing protein [Jaaginema sp. PMC 1079.18]